MTNAELVQYYVDLLIIQYRGQEKAPQHMAAFLENLTIYELIREVENGYNIDENLGPVAVGVQLDVIAKYVGANRIVTGIDFSRTYFGSADYGTYPSILEVSGSPDYGEINPPDAQILTYNSDQESLYSLTDSELLIIIKLKIAQNNSNHSTAEVDLILEEFFAGSVIFTDNENMTGSYIFGEDVRRLVGIAQTENAIPKPAGVGYTLSFVPDINNIFGSLDYGGTPPDFLSGSTAYGTPASGSSLTY